MRICRNSQRPLKGKRGNACAKLKGLPDKRRKIILFHFVKFSSLI